MVSAHKADFDRLYADVHRIVRTGLLASISALSQQRTHTQRVLQSNTSWLFASIVLCSLGCTSRRCSFRISTCASWWCRSCWCCLARSTSIFWCSLKQAHLTRICAKVSNACVTVCSCCGQISSILASAALGSCVVCSACPPCQVRCRSPQLSHSVAEYWSSFLFSFGSELTRCLSGLTFVAQASHRSSPSLSCRISLHYFSSSRNFLAITR